MFAENFDNLVTQALTRFLKILKTKAYSYIVGLHHTLFVTSAALVFGVTMFCAINTLT